jgi:hypothetical protein
MSASTAFSQVEKMLKECAPGSTIRLATHSRVIHFGNKVYRTFPKHDPVENGHIRKLVRFLEIKTACAAKYLPGIIKDDEAASDAKVKSKSVASAKNAKRR